MLQEVLVAFLLDGLGRRVGRVGAIALSGEAIVDFVEQLCVVSLSELSSGTKGVQGGKANLTYGVKSRSARHLATAGSTGSGPSPRIFSLQKRVEGAAGLSSDELFIKQYERDGLMMDTAKAPSAAASFDHAPSDGVLYYGGSASRFSGIPDANPEPFVGATRQIPDW